MIVDVLISLAAGVGVFFTVYGGHYAISRLVRGWRS